MYPCSAPWSAPQVAGYPDFEQPLVILDQRERPMTLITGLESRFSVIDYLMVAQHEGLYSKALAASRHGPGKRGPYPAAITSSNSASTAA
jgi:hypothetical protein